MKGNRLTRVADLLRHEIADILFSRMRDPRLGMVTVTSVDVAPDLRNASVHVSFLSPEDEFEKRVAILNHAAPYIRHELAGRHLDLRNLPELRFKPDHSLENAQRIQELLRGVTPPDAPGTEEEDAD